MCGIWAIFGSQISHTELFSSFCKIKHRGPDAYRLETVNHFQNCLLGFHRLALQENLQGMQPFRLSTHPHLILCYKGEIYNYKLLKRQFGFNYDTDLDGECILHLYIKGGAKYAAEHLDGVFAFIILDTKRKEVHIGRDTYGVRPLFRFTTDSGVLGISSEVKGLIDLVQKGKDNGQVSPYPPGYVSSYSLSQDGRCVLTQETTFHEPEKFPKYATNVTDLVDGQILENIRSLLVESVRKRIMGVRRIGCFLSGGLDSSLVAALVVKLAKELNIPYTVNTYSVGMRGSPDLAAARTVAKYLGTEHHEIEYTLTEAMAALQEVIYHVEIYDTMNIRSAVPLFLLSKYISTHTSDVIMFAGEGADEVAQGYSYFRHAPSAEVADVQSRLLLRNLYLHDNVRPDRCSAAHGLEVRLPFLDQLFASYYLSIPAEQRHYNCYGIEKYLIRAAFQLSGLIPDEILWRSKIGLEDGQCPAERPLSEYLIEYCESQVTDEEFAQARQKYQHNSPKSKEDCFYRNIFEKYFPNHWCLTPFMWTKKWVNDVVPTTEKTTTVTLENGYGHL